MRIVSILLLVEVLTACNSPGRPFYINIDPAVSPYVTAFINEASLEHRGFELHNLEVVLVPSLAEGQLGACYRGDGTPTVEILSSYWDFTSDLSKEQIVFHELGHCLLNREHDNSTINISGSDIPKSIMFSRHFSDSIYRDSHEYYMAELFTQ